MNENNFNEPLESQQPEVNGEAAEAAAEQPEKESNVIIDEEAAADSVRAEFSYKAEEKPAQEVNYTSYERPASYVREDVNSYSAGNGQSAYPYGTNQGAPRGNSYPYGSSYPYGNNNSYQNNPGGGYPYNMPPRQPGFAYNPDNNAPKKSKGAKAFAVIAGVLCVFLVAALIAVVAGDRDSTRVNTPEQTTVNSDVEEYVTNASPVTGSITSEAGELSPKDIYKKMLPSSVGILVYTNSKTLASEGSGVLFQESTDGKYTYIVTCAHVIRDASGYVRVQLYDGKEYDAQVVGYDARTDIGVIRIEKTGLTLAEIGDSSKIAVGDYVYAIGNPGGVEFANSFTNGMVSALDRPVSSSSTDYTMECIQHTAAINPGNSGGALVNSFGQVIGINSMKIVADDYEGMGFSVPSSVFVEIVNDIMRNGYVTNRPKLGITLVAASEYSTYGMFVAIKGLPAGSIVIYDIASDSNLVKTKVKKGDMITAANGVDLDTATQLQEIIEEMNVGDEITLSIVRIYEDYSYEEFDVTVALVEDRGDSFASAEEETTTSQGGYGGNYGGNYGGSYEDYFNQYFEDFFGSYFGGYGN